MAAVPSISALGHETGAGEGHAGAVQTDVWEPARACSAAALPGLALLPPCVRRVFPEVSKLCRSGLARPGRAASASGPQKGTSSQPPATTRQRAVPSPVPTAPAIFLHGNSFSRENLKTSSNNFFYRLALNS